MLKLLAANAVLVARDLNVAPLQQLWFVRNGLVTAEDFMPEPGMIFSPIAVNFSTRDFGFFAVSERVQVSLPSIGPSSKDVLARVVGQFAKAIGSPSLFPALGFNFLYSIHPESPSAFAEQTRRIFISDAHPWLKDFASSDARFGGYLSRDFMGFRQKTNCRPVRGEDGQEMLKVDQNFHIDISSISQIEEALSKWADCAASAEALSSSLNQCLDSKASKQGAIHA